jgi:hypothetical protein
VQSLESQPSFRRNMSAPLSMSKNNPRKEPAAELAGCIVLVSFFAYSMVLKMSVTRSSETSADFHRITRRYIP